MMKIGLIWKIVKVDEIDNLYFWFMILKFGKSWNLLISMIKLPFTKLIWGIFLFTQIVMATRAEKRLSPKSHPLSNVRIHNLSKTTDDVLLSASEKNYFLLNISQQRFLSRKISSSSPPPPSSSTLAIQWEKVRIWEWLIFPEWIHITLQLFCIFLLLALMARTTRRPHLTFRSRLHLPLSWNVFAPKILYCPTVEPTKGEKQEWLQGSCLSEYIITS